MHKVLATFILIACLVLPSLAQDSIPVPIVTMYADGVALEQVINKLSHKYGLQFYYSASKISIEQKITLKIIEQPLQVLLEQIKKQTGIDYKISGNKIILFSEGKSPKFSEPTSIYGYVQDSVTGERLIGVNIFFPDIQKGTVTNEYGYFSYALPSGKRLVMFSYMGYLPKTVLLDVSSRPEIISLQPGLVSLDEIRLVKRPHDKLNSLQAGNESVPMNLLHTYPALLGENDVLQFLKLLPGIQSSNEGSNGLYIRGATPTQTTFLLDDAPMFNMYHISGLFSTINPDAIKEVQVYKSHLPAKTGGALSSIVDIRLRDGNNQHYSVTGGIGTVTSRITVEGPIVKDKASFILSARRSYIGKVLSLFNGLGDISQIYFYDLNAKLNWIVNGRNRLYLSGYLGRDHINEQGGMAWGNSLLSFRWNKVFSEHLFSNITLTHSTYNHELSDYSSDNHARMITNLKNAAFKYDFTFSTNRNQRLNFGINSTFEEMLPLKYEFSHPEELTGIINHPSLERFIHRCYADANIEFGSKMGMDAGIRLSMLQNIHAGGPRLLLKPEPSVVLRYKVNENNTLKLAVSRNYQFYHGASIFEMIIPFERFLFTDSKIGPQYADHISSGYFFRKRDVEISVEAYYSWMHNQFRFNLGNELLAGADYQKLAVPGEAKACGLELCIKKETGKLTWLLSYTLSQINRKEDSVNSGKSYSPYYDRRHDISINLGFQASKRVNLSATWVMMSGNPYNFPVGKYEIRGQSVPLYAEDGYYNRRMPFYHRLDAGISIKLGGNKRFRQSLSFTIYNLYMQNNPIFYYYRDVADGDPGKNISTGLYNKKSFNMIGQYIFKFVPSFSYEFKFN